MQKQFGEALQIILVNAESKDSTLRFFKKHPKLKIPSVPLITAGNELWMRFSRSKIPYQLWLDPQRSVVYRTGPYNLTAKHLEAFVQDKQLSLLDSEEKSEDSAAKNNGALTADYHSFLTHYKPGLAIGNTSGAVVDEEGAIRLSCSGASVVDLYRTAYSEYDKYKFNLASEIDLQVGDPIPYIHPADENDFDEWKRLYSYSYELKLPASKKELRYKYMQQDLERYFGLDVKMEKRKLPCIALIKTGSLEKIKTKSTKKESSFIGRKYERDSMRYVHNYPFKEFAAVLGGMIEFNKQLPFVDRTGCSFNIDLELRSLSIDPFNLAELKKDVGKYNLDLIISEEWIDVLVISKK